MTHEEYLEMRLSLERQVRQLHSSGWNWRTARIEKNRVASRREVRYLEYIEKLKEESDFFT
jgi:hypothetical protein